MGAANRGTMCVSAADRKVMARSEQETQTETHRGDQDKTQRRPETTTANTMNNQRQARDTTETHR